MLREGMVRGSPNPLHLALPTRFRKARKLAGLTRASLAKQAGGGQTVSLDIENGQRVPTVAMLVRLASVLGVSASWLAYGLGDMKTDRRSTTAFEMGRRLGTARSQGDVSRAELARRTGLSPRAISKIEAGGQSGIDVICSLAKVLGVSPAWLAFGEGPQVLPSRRRSQPPAESVAQPD